MNHRDSREATPRVSWTRQHKRATIFVYKGRREYLAVQSTYRLGQRATLCVILVPGLLTATMIVLLTTHATRGFAMRMSRENSVIEFVTAGLMLAGGAWG